MSKVDTQQPDVRIFFKRFIDNAWDWNSMANLLSNLTTVLTAQSYQGPVYNGPAVKIGSNFPYWHTSSQDLYKTSFTEYVELMDGSFQTIDHDKGNSLVDVGDFKPSYEPILFEVTKGIVSVTTTINRTGIPGNATIKLFVPLSENNIFDKTLLARIPVSLINVAPLDTSKYSSAPNSFSDQVTDVSMVESLDTHRLDILKPLNRKKSIFKPMDKVQVWFRNRYATGYKFPSDYSVAFTGLLDAATVAYGAGKIDITITATDVLKWLKISRANVCASLSGQFATSNEPPIAYTTIFAMEKGSEIIKELILGREGTGYLSRDKGNGVVEYAISNKINPKNIEYQDGNINPKTKIYEPPSPVKSGYQLIELGPIAGIGKEFQLLNKITKATIQVQKKNGDTSKTPPPKQEANVGVTTTMQPGKEVFLLETDFDYSKLLIPDNLFGDWAPYKHIFSSFPLWQSDYRYRLDIAKEVADMTEFEFFADAKGCINYRPPLYWLTPGISYISVFNYKTTSTSGLAYYRFEPQYYIQDIDIINDSFQVSDKDIKTYVTVTGQYDYLDTELPQKINTTFKYDPTLVNKFGVRFNEKTLPLLAGADKAREYYAQAWLNRLNALYSSGSVTLVGMPELEIGRTVAFIGGLGKKLKGMNMQMREYANTLKTGTGANPNSLAGNVSPVQQQMKAEINKIFESLPVYYISTISHSYTQGKSFNTTLTLTHGRLFAQRFGTGILAYGVDDDDKKGMDQLMDSICKNTPDTPINNNVFEMFPIGASWTGQPMLVGENAGHTLSGTLPTVKRKEGELSPFTQIVASPSEEQVKDATFNK